MSFFWKNHIVTIFLIIAAVFLITFFAHADKSKNETSFLRKLVIESVSPFQGIVVNTFSSAKSMWQKYILLLEVQEENRDLKRQLSALAGEVNRTREMTLECLRLRKLLELKEQIELPLVAARVVGRDRASLFKSFVIDRGATDGVKIGDPVMAADGVVGKIIEVSWNSAKVLLLVDYNSRIDVFVQRQRIRGILEGCDGMHCILKYVPRTEEVAVGDVVVSSGLAGVFPKGLLLGEISEIKKSEAGLFQEIKVRPAVNVTKIEEVLVITDIRENDK
ncbi:MAG: rod shape-determining protein MreC [Syntrophales bacterium]|jgi:rod shape-determining protein MreC|nr:rod shape-determining protein MreC [Syntrophales bacterium]MDY0044279.1 rod shape-determining protein MreC [Syntrophales bacterium]